MGTSSGWTIGGGVRAGIDSSLLNSSDYLPGGSSYVAEIAASHSDIVTNGIDPSVGKLMPNIVYSDKYSWRIGDLTKSGYASVLSQQINKYYCSDIYFAWLALLENGGHDESESALMIIELKDMTTDELLVSRRSNVGVGEVKIGSGFLKHGRYFYTPSWQIEHLSIDSTRLGHDFLLTVFSADCSQAGHQGRVYVDNFGSVAPSQTLLKENLALP